MVELSKEAEEALSRLVGLPDPDDMWSLGPGIISFTRNNSRSRSKIQILTVISWLDSRDGAAGIWISNHILNKSAQAGKIEKLITLIKGSSSPQKAADYLTGKVK